MVISDGDGDCGAGDGDSGAGDGDSGAGDGNSGAGDGGRGWRGGKVEIKLFSELKLVTV